MKTFLVLLVLSSSAFAATSVCRLQGAIDGFGVYVNDHRYVQFPSLYDAKASYDKLISNGTCTAKPVTDVCSIRPSRIGFEVLQGKSSVSQYWFVDDAAIMRDVMIEDGMCSFQAPTETCVIRSSAEGFRVFIGNSYVSIRETNAEAQQLVKDIQTAAVCL